MREGLGKEGEVGKDLGGVSSGMMLSSPALRTPANVLEFLERLYSVILQTANRQSPLDIMSPLRNLAQDKG